MSTTNSTQVKEIDRNYLSKIYFWSIYFIGILAFIFTFIDTSPSHHSYKNILEFLFFIVLNIFAEIVITKIPTGGSLTASFSIILTVLLIQGPLYAIISAVIGATISDLFTQKRSWKIVLFNSSLFSIIFSVAGQATKILEKVFTFSKNDQIFSIFIMAFLVTLIYIFLSSLIVNTYICITTGLKFLDTIKEDRWEFTQLAILTPISVLGVYFYQSIGIFATLAAFLPAIITVYGIRNYINMNESNENLKLLNDDLEQLYMISKKISSQNKLIDLWRMISKEAVNLIPYDRCSIYLLNKDFTTLIREADDMVYTDSEEYDLLEEGPLQKCVAKRVDILNNNFVAPTSYKQWQEFKSVILEPIILSGEVIGVISLLAKEKDAFSINHLKFIKLLISSIENTIKSINLYEQTQKQALIDGLTGLYNQKYFKNQVDSELTRANQHKQETSVIMFDVDYFKKFNDTHGHLLGDLVLKEMSRILKNFIKTTYVASRYGGEEFALLLPETKLEDACELAEKIRKVVNQHKFMGREQREVHLSISMGVNSHVHSMGDVSKIEFIDRADTALYRAKNEGRNQVYKSIYIPDKEQLIIKKYTKEDNTQDKKNIFVFTLDKKACQSWIEFFDKFNLWINSEENIHLRTINDDYKNFFLKLITNKLDSSDKKITLSEEIEIQTQILEKLYFPTDFYKFEIEIEDLEKVLFDYIATFKTSEIEKEFIRKIIIGIFNKVYAMAVKYTSNHYQKIIDFHTNIAHINSEIGSISTKNTFYSNIAKLTSELITTKFAFIAELDDHKKRFVVKAFYGTNDLNIYDKYENLLLDKLTNRLINYTDTIQISGDEIKEVINNEFLDESSINSLLVVPLVKKDKEISGIVVCLDDKIRQFTLEEINICKEITERVIKAISRIEKNDSEKDSYIDIIKSMIDVFESRDNTTKDHSKNISRLSGRISNILGLPKEEENEIRIAAYLHDIGKLSTNQDSIKSHTVIGSRILSMSQELKKFAPIILHHHENWDGSGYPDGLAENSIPLYSRIISIANQYEDYMKEGLEHSIAIEKMKNSNHFDIEICKAIENHIL
jgi:diguanylate cyclase (GGDEF)-like protein/putative nucleotidyltransferase with HDIG domain